MAISVAVTNAASDGVVGHLRHTISDVTLDNSYVGTTGYALNASDLRLGAVQYADAKVVTTGTNATAAAKYTPGSTGRLQLYTTTAQVANATDLTNTVVRVDAYGTI